MTNRQERKVRRCIIILMYSNSTKYGGTGYSTSESRCVPLISDMIQYVLPVLLYPVQYHLT